MQICRGFTDTQWTELGKRLQQDGSPSNDDAAWRCAIEVFERRIRERFLSCVEALQTDDSKLDVEVPSEAPADCSTLPKDVEKDAVVPGFAIMALCCLLIETLQSFREARESPLPAAAYPNGPCVRPQPATTDAFRNFLRLPAFRGEFDDKKVATSFVRGVRNGIFHDAETRRWVIWREEPKDRILMSRGNGGYALNRTEFFRALKTEFENYVQQLRDTQNTELRSRFVEKMNRIVRVS